MAKSKEKKPKPKPPENAATVQEIRKEIAARKERLAKVKDATKKDGKVNKVDPKFRSALKRVKRAQRKLAKEAIRLRATAAAAAAAAPAGGEEKKA